MQTVRIGVIGLGMGGSHARRLMEGQIRRATLAAVCDLAPERRAPFAAAARCFDDAGALFRSGTVDAVVIATPHYAHTTLGIQALKRGLHVLVEKPVSVHKADAERLIAAHTNPRQVFAAMFNMRAVPGFAAVRRLVQAGELGALRRVNWISTDWFRTDAYYASGGWRATWKGEGGGVLLNQCPHQLDLLQWIAGMPARVQARCAFGKYHPIEVEDEVTAVLEYANGATGVFLASTGEAPGTNRLELCGDRGKIVVEHGRFLFVQNAVPMDVYRRESPERTQPPGVVCAEIPAPPPPLPPHAAILQNFAANILDGTPLIAPAEEGIRSVELANAMILSSLRRAPVDLPLDGRRFARALRGLIRQSEAARRPAATRGSTRG